MSEPTDIDQQPTEPDLVGSMLIALALNGLWMKITADPDIAPSGRLDALGAGIVALQDQVSALRMVAQRHLNDYTSPSQVEARAAAAKASATAKRQRDAERGRVLAASIERREAEEGVRKCAAALDRARAVAARFERPGAESTDDQRVLAAGAVHGAEQAHATAVARLADLKKQAKPAGQAVAP